MPPNSGIACTPRARRGRLETQEGRAGHGGASFEAFFVRIRIEASPASPTMPRMARRWKIDRDAPEPEALAAAKATLAGGGLVIVPTETVYGVACDPSVHGAMEKLRAAKGRDAGKPVALLIAEAAQAERAALDPSAGFRALAARWWPGPLTIVLDTPEGATGFRVPDHPVALALARLYGRPLALTSANPSGGPDPRTAREAIAGIPSAEWVLDAGPASADALPSTVVRLADGRIECLREGAIPFAEVERVFRAGNAPAPTER